ncbi:hypothetical protein DPMN_109490 [Dreissena polymorpha]|uniref:Uncharacterized protein n=1 Tax=Dreissena polymorpha TaxID=45954 RepID=A0A9D4KAD0_DREPO|nr:hypothetical protein DPMN_109490 [Dreissena polymorpha]
MAAAILRSLAGDVTGHDMTDRSPVWSGHRSGLVTGPVIGDRSGPVTFTGPVQSGPVTGQQSEEGIDLHHRMTLLPTRHRRMNLRHQGVDIGHAHLRRAILIATTRVGDHVVVHGDAIPEDLGLIAADLHLDFAADPDRDIAENEDVDKPNVDIVPTIRIVDHRLIPFMESHVSSPHVSAPMLTATHVGTSGAQLKTTATLSAPRVSSTVSSRVPPNATHSSPDVLWVQIASGHFVPVNTDKHYQIADVVDDNSSLPDNLAQDSFIPVPAVSLHTSVPEESEAESDADIDTDKFLASSTQIYELIFQTLGEELCPRPVETSSNSTISITKQLVRTFDPTMVT